MSPALFLLTCANKKEADKIIQTLLEKKLIACGKKIKIDSSFRWQCKIEKDNETLVLLESMKSKFKIIESEIRKLHSHKTFVLFEIPIEKCSKGVKEWINDETS